MNPTNPQNPTLNSVPNPQGPVDQSNPPLGQPVGQIPPVQTTPGPIISPVSTPSIQTQVPPIASQIPPYQSVPAVNPAISGSPQTQSYDYASFGTRFWAVVIDSFILGTISGLLSLPFTIGAAIVSQSSQGATAPNGGFIAIQAISQLLTFVLYLAYPLYFIGKKGATPGKSIMKIKVIRKDSPEEIGIMGAFLRESVGKLLSSFLLIGYFTMIKDPNKQTWHDKIANTIVVKVN